MSRGARWRGLSRVAAGLVISGAVAACANAPAPEHREGGGLTVLAAASLRAAFTAVAVDYRAETGTLLTFSFDASSALRAQIEQGAPADVFASADEANPMALFDDGLADGPPVAFAGNALTIIVPADNPAAIGSPADLARPGVRIVAAGGEVPITTYAQRAIANLARLDGYPPGYEAAVAANIVTREDNVGAVAAKIELGEGDAAIVYVTDARAAGDAVAAVPIPAEANVLATYTAVVVGTSDRREAGHDLLRWLTGDPGQAILADHGFLAAP